MRLSSNMGLQARRWEAPTWILVFTIYGGWLTVTFWWHTLPIWAAAPLGTWFCAWHMSLQHELMHGHPTRNPGINGALAWPPLNLWLPYAIYRDSHLRHHRDAQLTDPLEDPESTYMSGEAWAVAGPARRGLHNACNSLIGRLLIGPAWTMAGFWVAQAQRPTDGLPGRVWLGHAVGVGLVLAWLSGACHLSPVIYLACCVYPATALILLRSLAEHRAAARPEDRTAVVEHAGLLGLLYLNNNLHLLHHESPSIPWYALPSQWRQSGPRLLATHHGPRYRSYLEIALRYAWRPQHPGPHPLAGGADLRDQVTLAAS